MNNGLALIYSTNLANLTDLADFRPGADAATASLVATSDGYALLRNAGLTPSGQD